MTSFCQIEEQRTYAGHNYKHRAIHMKKVLDNFVQSTSGKTRFKKLH